MKAAMLRTAKGALEPGAERQPVRRDLGRVRNSAELPVPLFLLRSGVPLLRKSASCGCGQCAACRADDIRVSQADDPLERAADAAADRVMRSAEPAGSSKAPGRAEATSREGHLVPAGGAALDAVTRAFMEPRFDARFGSVRIHDGAEAAQRANAFAARAYAVGEHLVFGAGEYRPGTDSGRRLIAHELTHVLQQRHPGGSSVQRTVDPAKLSCPANKAGAGADPAADLEKIDGEAQGLADSMAIFATLSTLLNPATSTHSFDVAYQTRMGPPQPVGKKFRNRFSGKLLASEEDAAKQEVEVLATRFSRISDFLAGSIRYKCRANGVTYTLGDCTGHCPSGRNAETCVPNDKRTIGICPAFWGLGGDDERAGTLIHEVAHARLDFSGHGHGSRAQRGRNPACYESMVADVFGFAPDAKCPPI
jgi:hypothetical protein